MGKPSVKIKIKVKGKSVPDALQKVQGAPVQLPALNLQRFAQGPKGAK